MHELFFEVYQKYQKKDLLFSQESPALIDLFMYLKNQSRKTIVIFIFNEIEVILYKLDNHYQEDILSLITLSKKWVSGEIKMPLVKKSILRIHKLAKVEKDKSINLYLKAIAYGISSIHASGHLNYFIIYLYSALVYKFGINHFLEEFINEKDLMLNRLNQAIILAEETYQWADFLKEKNNENN